MISILTFIAVAISPHTSAQSADAGGVDGGSAALPKLTNQRYNEDYSYLRDPANRTGTWWEKFKYIPLDITGNAYLTLGLEFRLREEAYRNFNWGEVSVDNYQWYRVMPYADLHLGPNLRLFGQLIGADFV